MPILSATDIRKNYGSLEVLRGVSLQVERGETVSIIGPSGSGKSTILRCLINIERIDGGDIEVDGSAMVRGGVYAEPATLRDFALRMGMVFQNFNLFPHMTVRKNLELAPALLKKFRREQIRERSEALLRKVGLADKANVYPDMLSGGQKQRVAIARALMLDPEIMLFDEPTSALDPELTGEVLNVIRNLARERMTMLIVTHEMSFAADVSNRVIFIDNGEIVEQGPAARIFTAPVNQRTREFLTGYLGK